MKKSKTLAIVRRPDPVGQIIKAVTPPPKKADVLRATAQAMVDAEKVAHQAIYQALKDADEQLLAEIRKRTPNLVNAECDISIGSQYKNGDTEGYIAVKVNLPADLQAKYRRNEAEWGKANLTRHYAGQRNWHERYQQILSELRERAHDRSHG